MYLIINVSILDFRRYWKAAVDVVLPRTCVVCGCRLNLDESHICLGCLADMPLTRFWERGHNPMADKFNGKVQEWIQEREACSSGEKTDEGTGAVEYERYCYAAALFMYHSEAGYRHIPYQIKYQGNTAAGRYFGKMLGRKLAGYSKGKDETEFRSFWSDVDMIIPVPLHWTRRWKRGYNQAEVIARGVAEAMNVPVNNDILVRRRRTKTQIKLNIDEKARNVNGAFAVAEEAGVIFRNGGGVRHIVLVDDVFTTGSTLAACFRALREVFPPSVRISAVTLGYLER